MLSVIPTFQPTGLVGLENLFLYSINALTLLTSYTFAFNAIAMVAVRSHSMHLIYDKS